MNEVTPQGGAPSPVHLARRALRYWPTAALVFVSVVVIGGAVSTRVDQVYRSESVILYRQPPRTGAGSGEGENSKRVGARLQDMVLAHDRLRKTIDDLKLFRNTASPQEAVDEMKKKVAFRVRDGSTFQISYDAEEPKLAQTVTARLTEGLIADHARIRVKEAEETRRVLEQERVRYVEDVQRREAALAAFVQEHPEAIQQRPTGAESLGASPTELANMEMQIERLRSGGTTADVARVAAGLAPDSPAIAEQRRSEAALALAERELQDRLQRYTDAHPDVIAARERVNNARLAALKGTAAAAGVATPQPAEAAGPSGGRDDVKRQIAILERHLSGMRKGKGSSIPRVTPRAAQLEVQLRSLQYDLQEARERLATHEDRQGQAALMAKLESSGQTGQLSVLDPAYLPGLPLVDVKKKVALAAIAAALMLAMAAALLRALTDDRIYDRRDVEWMSAQPVLTAVPGLRGRRITARA